jgi:predicted small secreted protein
MSRILALLLMLSYVAITGCNTVEGAGKDIERGGEKMQNSAKDTKQKM